MATDGCPWIMCGRKKGEYAFTEYCGKLPQTNPPSQFCPKHALIHIELPKERARRGEKRKALQEYRKQQAAELAASPLAGFNPLFDEHDRRNSKRSSRKQEQRVRA